MARVVVMENVVMANTTTAGEMGVLVMESRRFAGQPSECAKEVRPNALLGPAVGSFAHPARCKCTDTLDSRDVPSEKRFILSGVEYSAELT